MCGRGELRSPVFVCGFRLFSGGCKQTPLRYVANLLRKNRPSPTGWSFVRDMRSFLAERRDTALFVDKFSLKTTFLADRVLAVPSRSRQQKQTVGLRRPSIGELTVLFAIYCAKVLERGVGETSFKKFPPQKPTSPYPNVLAAAIKE